MNTKPLTKNAKYKERYQKHAGTIQFVFLALIYGVPLFSNQAFSPVAQETLESILGFEFGVLIYGWMLVSLFFVPLVLVDSVWLRWTCIIIAGVIGIPMISGYSDIYGAWGMLCFTWLLFINYCSVFLARMNFTKRGRMAGEIGLRCIVYVVFFSLLTQVLYLPSSVESWQGKGALLFGFIYFSILAIVEFKRYFPRSINIFFHLIRNTYVRPPKSRIRYKNGRIKAYILENNNIHQWPLLLFCGIACTGISSVTYCHSLDMESWGIMIGLWIFLVPFFLLGSVFLLTIPAYFFSAFSAGPPLLKISNSELTLKRQLISEGFIPRYSKKETRERVEAELICYKISSIEEDIVAVEKLVCLAIDQDLQYITTDEGTRISVVCQVPELEKKYTKQGIFYLWHLQFTLKEKVSHKHKAMNIYTWKLAFPLPVS